MSSTAVTRSLEFSKASSTIVLMIIHMPSISHTQNLNSYKLYIYNHFFAAKKGRKQTKYQNCPFPLSMALCICILSHVFIEFTEKWNFWKYVPFKETCHFWFNSLGQDLIKFSFPKLRHYYHSSMYITKASYQRIKNICLCSYFRSFLITSLQLQHKILQELWLPT